MVSNYASLDMHFSSVSSNWWAKQGKWNKEYNYNHVKQWRYKIESALTEN